MQKRNVIIFSLISISILFIAGCQYSAVGGGRGISYSASEDLYTRMDSTSSIKTEVSFRDCRSPSGTNARSLIFKKGYALIDGVCYEYKDCINLYARDPEAMQTGRSIVVLAKKSSVDIPCYQNGAKEIDRDEIMYDYKILLVLIE